MKYRVALFSGFTGSQKPEQWLCLAGLGGSKLPSFAFIFIDNENNEENDLYKVTMKLLKMMFEYNKTSKDAGE